MNGCAFELVKKAASNVGIPKEKVEAILKQMRSDYIGEISQLCYMNHEMYVEIGIPSELEDEICLLINDIQRLEMEKWDDR